MEATPPPCLRIILVEDHADTLRLLAQGLQKQGHVVVTVTTMQDAANLLPRSSYDVLLSDIGLPDGDGWTLLANLPEPHPPILIAVSGHGSEEDIARSKAAGFQWHIVKPLKLDKLKVLLDEAVLQLKLEGFTADSH